MVIIARTLHNLFLFKIKERTALLASRREFILERALLCEQLPSRC